MTHAVGYGEGRILDPERSNWDDDGPRPISWAAWWPASGDAASARRTVGGPNGAWFDMGALAEDAAVSNARPLWPVVLLSHGTGGSPQPLSWLARPLAAAGVVVLAPLHHGNTAFEPPRAEGFLAWWERALDATTLLDAASRDGPLAGRLDLSRVAAAGFSLGAHTALSLAGARLDMFRFDAFRRAEGGPSGVREFPDLAAEFPRLMQSSERFRRSFAAHGDPVGDPRVRAVFALAPPATVRGFTPESLAAMSAPTLIVSGAADVDAPPEHGPIWLGAQNPNFRVEILPEPIDHYVFVGDPTDAGRREAPELCSGPAGVDRGALHRSVASAALTHLTTALDAST